MTAASLVAEVSRIAARYEPDVAWDWRAANAAAIAAHWQERVAAQPKLFNGTVLMARAPTIADGVYLETTGGQSGWGYFGTAPADFREVGGDETGTLDLVYFHTGGDWLTKILPVGAERAVSGRGEAAPSPVELQHLRVEQLRASRVGGLPDEGALEAPQPACPPSVALTLDLHASELDDLGLQPHGDGVGVAAVQQCVDRHVAEADHRGVDPVGAGRYLPQVEAAPTIRHGTDRRLGEEDVHAR